MGAIYRLGLIIAGCYFEGAVRNASQLALYWIGKQDALLGFLPYLIPVLFGYIFAVNVGDHWSDSLLKNDIMAYVGSTLLTGYPLLVSLSLWFAGAGLDPTSSKVRIASTVLLLVNLAIAVLVWRSAIRRGYPLSLPWGGVSKKSVDASLQASEPDAQSADQSVDPGEDLQTDEASEAAKESQLPVEPETE